MESEHDNIDYDAINVDSYCVNNDIDDYDLFGEIMVGDNCDDEFGNE